MQFGIVLPIMADYADWEMLSNIAREAEELGYDSIWVNDHFIPPGGGHYGLEPWTVLSALSGMTSGIKLGTYVLCNQFRHPSLLAKMASTLDNITRGRLELGIGAGWLKDEHIAFGFEWYEHPERIKRLEEAVRIMKKLWTENHVSYNGAYFQLEEATLQPRPFQKLHPPIWIGGGSRAIKRLVAELADGWISLLSTPEKLANDVKEIRYMMRMQERGPESLQVAYGGSGCAIIGEDEESVERMAEPLARSMGKPLEELPCLTGTPEQCIKKVEQYETAGARTIIAGFYDFPSLNGMRLFAKEVIPHFK